MKICMLLRQFKVKSLRGDDVMKIPPNFNTSEIYVFQYFMLKKWKLSLQWFICKDFRKIIYLV